MEPVLSYFFKPQPRSLLNNLEDIPNIAGHSNTFDLHYKQCYFDILPSAFVKMIFSWLFVGLEYFKFIIEFSECPCCFKIGDAIT